MTNHSIVMLRRPKLVKPLFACTKFCISVPIHKKFQTLVPAKNSHLKGHLGGGGSEKRRDIMRVITQRGSDGTGLGVAVSVRLAD